MQIERRQFWKLRLKLVNIFENDLFFKTQIFKYLEALALKGDAEAYAIEEKAKAESNGMAQKADAFKDYGKAAKVQT